MKKSLKVLIVFAFVALFVAVWMVLGDEPTDVRIVPEKMFDVAPAGHTVPDSSYMIAAPRLTAARNWVSGADYVHGDIVRSTENNSRLYWCVSGNLTGETASVNPNQHDGDLVDGNLTWRRIPPHNRNGIIIINGGENNVWLAVGDKNTTAVANKGIILTPGAAWWVDLPLMQFGVFAISDTGTDNLILVQEW